MKILTQEEWTFEALEDGFPIEQYFPLWDHGLYVPCKKIDIEIDRILTGFFNVSMPQGLGSTIYMEETDSGLTAEERRILTIYFDEDEKMVNKRVLYHFVQVDGLVTDVQFFLCRSDVEPN